jgi:hypothetical protein
LVIEKKAQQSYHTILAPPERQIDEKVWGLGINLQRYDILKWALMGIF